jgi:hypothetical protein
VEETTMLNPCRVVKVALVLGLVLIGVSVVAHAGSAVCENTKGAARGLCEAYCVHMQCNTPGTNASDTACHSVAAQFEKITGVPLVCSTSPFTCTCAGGILNCSATGLVPGATGYLNIDLTAYSYGFNGVGDALIDASGNVHFPPFDLFAYLADRNLVLSSVIMAVTNQPGQILLETIVPTCPR